MIPFGGSALLFSPFFLIGVFSVSFSFLFVRPGEGERSFMMTDMNGGDMYESFSERYLFPPGLRVGFS